MDEAAFRDLISGKRSGVTARLARCGLRVGSVAYSAGSRLRNWKFDLGLRPVRSAGVPVISVGNITTGGTGKTPFVAWLTNWFRERDVNVALLSRGYRSLNDSANDEKLVLEQCCPGVPHVQNPDRVAGAVTCVREHNAQLIILDDGFQHRRLARDLDIVLIDATCPFGYDHVLPRGLLREPLSGLRRADIVVLTRIDQVDNTQRDAILAVLERWRGSRECVSVCFPPTRLRNLAGDVTDLSTLNGGGVFAFCGIGNPDGFRATLDSAGLNVIALQPFADHHHYSRADLTALADSAVNAGANAAVTTQKDLVKIPAQQWNGPPLWSIEIGTQIVDGASRLQSKLEGIRVGL